MTQLSVVGKAILNNHEVSGPLLFFRYAFPCIEIRVRTRRLAEKSAAELLRSGHSNTGPPIGLLERCFPDPCLALKASAGLGASEELIWSVDNVRKFWRSHGAAGHDHQKDSCSTMWGIVESINGLGPNIRKPNCQPVLTINQFGLPIAIGDKVFFHHHIIAEVEPQSVVEIR